jgi:DNA-binding protein HU-beta
MNKQQLIEKVAQQSGTSQLDAERSVNAILAEITSEVAGGGEVVLAGFGKFTVAHRKARQGRNPATGESIQIAASKAPKFSALGAFKAAVKG